MEVEPEYLTEEEVYALIDDTESFHEYIDGIYDAVSIDGRYMSCYVYSFINR